MSTAPVWENGHLISRSMVLRTYVLNTGNGWIALPGGLVRVAEAEGSVVSMQRGGHSKDAWVLWDGPVDTFSMLRPRNEPVELRACSQCGAEQRGRQRLLAGPVCGARGEHRADSARR